MAVIILYLFKREKYLTNTDNLTVNDNSHENNSIISSIDSINGIKKSILKVSFFLISDYDLYITKSVTQNNFSNAIKISDIYVFYSKRVVIINNGTYSVNGVSINYLIVKHSESIFCLFYMDYGNYCKELEELIKNFIQKDFYGKKLALIVVDASLNHMNYMKFGNFLIESSKYLELDANSQDRFVREKELLPTAPSQEEYFEDELLYPRLELSESSLQLPSYDDLNENPGIVATDDIENVTFVPDVKKNSSVIKLKKKQGIDFFKRIYS